MDTPGLNIVLIEPDKALAAELCDFLHTLGHTAVVYHDLPDAYSVLPAADALIWAYDGRELERIQHRFGTAEIFLAVSADLVPRVVGMMGQGVTDYLLRPYHLPELQTRLHSAFPNQPPLQTDIQRLQAAIASNVRLGKANEALARLHKLNDVLKAIVDNVPQISSTAAGAVVCFYNFATNRFEVDKAAGWGLGHNALTWPVTPPQEGGILDRVLEQGLVTVLTAEEQAQLSNTVHQQLEQAGIHAFIGLRLRAGQEPLGALFVNYQAPYSLTGIDKEEELGRLKLYADQAAFAMERAYLFERNNQERQLLHDVAKATRTGQGFEESAWEPVLEEAMEITGAERGSIILLNDLGFTAPLNRGFSAEYAAVNSELNGRIYEHIKNHKEIIFVQDLPRQPEWQALQGTISQARSILAVPIIDNQKGTLLGIINLKSSQPHAFDEADQELVKSLAQRAEIAINAVYAVRQSLDHESERLKALYTAAKLINQAGQNPQVVLQTILDEARHITDSYFGTLQLLSEDKQYLEFIAASPSHHWQELMDSIHHMPIDGPGITTWAARDNEAKLVPDTRQEPRFVESPGGPTGSELVVVLRDELGQPLGVLNVEHRQPNGLTEEDRLILLALADLVMMAFKHATYRQELSRAKSELANVEALAWRGLFGSNWWHSAAQESGVIKWTVRRLRRKTTPEVQPLLDQITEAARRIETIPKFSWLPEGVASSTELLLIDRALKFHVSNLCQHKPGIQLIFDLKCTGVHVPIADAFLELALEKLIDNAIRATNGRGTLTIGSEINHEVVFIFIEDDGPGVPEKHREYFLKRPVPKAADERGSGLGGLIARFVFERHGGQIEPIYLPLRGTRIQITLPLHHRDNYQANGGTP